MRTNPLWTAKVIAVAIVASALALASSLVPARSAAAAPGPLISAGMIPVGAIPLASGEYFLPSEKTLNVQGMLVSPAQLADIYAIAEATGGDLATVTADFLWQEEFGAAATVLEEEFPDQYASARRLEARGGPYLAFKGPVPERAEQLVADLSQPVMLIGERGYSKAELTEVQAAAFRQVTSHPHVATASSIADDSTGVITIEVEPIRSLTSNEEEGLYTSLRPVADNPAIAFEVVIVDKVHSLEPEASLRGGGYFNNPASTSADRKCTTGFTVRHVAGQRPAGFATAGHCGRLSQIRWFANQDLSGWTSHTVATVHEGSFGDLATYTMGSSSNQLMPQFYSSRTAITNVMGSRNPQVDDVLCVFGAVSGRGCATVDALNLCRISSREICSLARVNADLTQGGDSGGPWFAGGYAYGIHAGSSSAVNKSYFTPVSRLSNLWGMVVVRVGGRQHLTVLGGKNAGGW